MAHALLIALLVLGAVSSLALTPAAHRAGHRTYHLLKRKIADTRNVGG